MELVFLPVRRQGGVLSLSLASALRCLPFKRRPCAGRHLLFFAAAKKSGPVIDFVFKA
jgi:hypothetical protein